MNLKQSALTAAVAATMAMASGQAAAFVYADSGLTINNLTLGITPTGSVTVTRFDFNMQNTAVLNGATDIKVAACGGTPGPGNNNCAIGPPVLDALAANAPGSTIIRPNNSTTGGNFTSFTPAAGGDWSNSDTVATTAELVNLGSPTNTNQIAESLLTGGSTASASSLIQSVTGFTLDFTVTGGPASLSLAFLADPDLRAQILNELGTMSAQANINVSFTLVQDSDAAGGTLGRVTWSPDGSLDGNCFAVRGPTCTETADSQDLNTNVGVSSSPATSDSSWDPNNLQTTPFGINVTGLDAGHWTLTLAATTSTQLARTPTTVPEPGILALLGVGLVGAFASTRRRRKTA